MSLPLLLLAACSGAGQDSGPEGCTPGTCTLDPCAELTPTASAIECCITNHGRGLEGEAASDLARLCSGEACASEQYLSEEAARCAAQAYGLALGEGGCLASFRENGDDNTFVWVVENVTEQTCSSGIWIGRSGDTVTVGALAGELVSEGAYAD